MRAPTGNSYFCGLGSLGLFAGTVSGSNTLECTVQVAALGEPMAHEETVSVSVAYGATSEVAVGVAVPSSGPTNFTVYNCAAVSSCQGW